MRSVEWDEGAVKMIDQRALPWTLQHVSLDTSKRSPKASRI